MRIVQILESVSWGDAISNHVWALDALFEAQGIEHGVYARFTDDKTSVWAKNISEYDPKPSDTIVYQLSIGTDLNYQVAEYPGKLIVNYHNITPGSFFDEYNKKLADACRSGREGLAYLAQHAESAIAVSSYNAQELVEAGYRCPIEVIPILLDYEMLGANRLSEEEKDSRCTSPDAPKLLFVGRVVPNKRIERVIEDFWYVKQAYPKATLVLVGNLEGMEVYTMRLDKFVRKLGLGDSVTFAGRVSQEELLDHYRTADVFLCESAHEGFCVPLVEAMLYGVPIVAQDTSACGETLGEGGMLLKNDDPREAALAVDLVVRSEELRRAIRLGQKRQLERFDPANVADAYLDYFQLR